MRRAFQRFFIGILLTSPVILSCEKDGELSSERKLEYFPVEPGHSVTYEVNSMRHDSALGIHDTSHYFIRRTIAKTFIDNEGRRSYRIERFRKDSMAGDWRIEDVWVANRNRKRAEQVEENRRFTKMIFPIRSDERWDGNAYNDLPEQEYRYEDLHQEKLVGGERLDSTVKVVQKDVENLIERESAFETYALGIGMVRKEKVDLDTYTNGGIRKGSELYMRMIDHHGP